MGAIKHATSRAALRRQNPSHAEPATAAQPATFTACLVALDERGQAWLIPDDAAEESGARPARHTPRAARSV